MKNISDVEMLFGGGMAFTMMIERERFGRTQRLNKNDSEYLGLQVLSGKLEQLDFEDYLGFDNPLSNLHSTSEELLSQNV